MTIGSALYLLMVIASFGVFSVVLAYESWQQGRAGAANVPHAGRPNE
jgi:hypothetical protein